MPKAPNKFFGAKYLAPKAPEKICDWQKAWKKNLANFFLVGGGGGQPPPSPALGGAEAYRRV